MEFCIGCFTVSQMGNQLVFCLSHCCCLMSMLTMFIAMKKRAYDALQCNAGCTVTSLNEWCSAVGYADCCRLWQWLSSVFELSSCIMHHCASDRCWITEVFYVCARTMRLICVSCFLIILLLLISLLTWIAIVSSPVHYIDMVHFQLIDWVTAHVFCSLSQA